jgi:glyoxylase-like metal-dependent hydrolase (beta-lactamase superfamily II)
MSSPGRALLNSVQTLDLNFLGIPGAIAVYLIRHRSGAVLIESGPGSTQPALTAALQNYDLTPRDISDVLLTHIHLDHAGAAGWLASQGARIHVHPAGAPHLIDPEKLLNSAQRIYGDQMDLLWGKFLPVPEERLSILEDGHVLQIEGLDFLAIDTPGHANHHFAYLFEGTCFTGDIGGIRLNGLPHVRIPMPPPEFHLEKWRESVKRLRQEDFNHIAPTHFGIYSDPGWHLDALERMIDDVEEWMETTLPSDPPVETINERFLQWTGARSQSDGLEPGDLEAYEAANPSWMSGYGMQRYWRKHRIKTSDR